MFENNLPEEDDLDETFGADEEDDEIEWDDDPDSDVDDEEE